MPSRRENLDLPGGCLAGLGGVSTYPDAGSLYVGVGANAKREITNRVGHHAVYSRESAGVGPAERARPVEADLVGQRLRDVELAAGRLQTAVDHLGEHLRPAVGDVDLDAARKHRVRDAERLRVQPLAAGRAAARTGGGT